MPSLDNPRDAAKSLIAWEWDRATHNGLPAEPAQLVERFSAYYKPGDVSPGLTAEQKLISAALEEIRTKGFMEGRTTGHALRILSDQGKAPSP